MSEEITTQPESAVSDTPDQVNQAPSPTQNTEPTPSEYAYVPPKFMKADGTPDFEKLAKSYVSLEKGFSKKPNLPAASIDEYDYKFGEGFAVDEERTAAFKADALAKGLTKDQYAWIMDTYSKQLQTSQADAWTADKVQQTLEGEWGTDFQHNLSAANKAFEAFAPSDASIDDPVWNHPAVMKLLARMGAELGEDSVSSVKGTSVGGSMSRQDIEAIQFSEDYWNDPAKQQLVTAWYEKNVK
ncbi:MAG: hypothetical protein V4757_06680 [Pseudomonadota bacterium]